MLILFGMPIVQLILFGFAIRNEVNNAYIAVLDLSKDDVTEAVTNRLVSSGYFRLAEYLDSEEGVEDVFRRGKVKELVVFEPQFAERLRRTGKANMRVVADASDPNTAKLLVAYTTSIVNSYTQGVGAQRPVIAVVPETRLMFNPEMKSVYMFVPGLVALILMLVSALMTSITITREKELGTMEILLVSPLRPLQIIVGKVLPYLLLSLFNVVSVLVLARFLFHVPFRGSVLLFMAESVLYILTALSLGIMISTVSKTQQAAMMASLGGLMLPTILLSGFVFPVENMPVPLQVISNIIPARWFVDIARGIMLKGSGLDYLWQETLVLAGMAVAMLTVSVRKFNERLQ